MDTEVSALVKGSKDHPRDGARDQRGVSITGQKATTGSVVIFQDLIGLAFGGDLLDRAPAAGESFDCREDLLLQGNLLLSAGGGA